MKGLLSPSQNEKGNTLLLVLFLVFLLSAISAPLLLSLSQGNVNNKKGQLTEQAQYAAESGMAIVKRVMQEAFYQENLDLNESQVQAIINGINNIPLVDEADVETKLEGSKLAALGSANLGTLKRERVVTLNYYAKQGSALPPGVFGNDVVSQYSLSDKIVFKTKPNGIHENYGPSFVQEFKDAFNLLMKEQPNVASNRIDLNSSSFCSNTPLPNGVTCDSNNIYFKNNSDIVLSGDVITKGDIIIETSRKVTIAGNLAAGGIIKITGGDSQLIVKKSVYSEKGIEFTNTIRTVDIGENLVSNTYLKFYTINGGGTLKIGGSIITNGVIEFYDINNDFSIEGSISTNDKLLFHKNAVNNKFIVLGSIFINNSNSSQDTFVFESNIGKFYVTGSILSTGNVLVKQAVNTPGMKIDGALLTLGDLTFLSSVNEMIVKKTVGCLGNLNFGTKYNVALNNDLYFGGASIGGTFHAPYPYNSKRIIINYNPAVGGGTDERILLFSNWSGK